MKTLLTLGVMTVCSVGHTAALPFFQVVQKQVVNPVVERDWAQFNLHNKAITVYFKAHHNRGINEMRFYFKDRNLTDAQAASISALAAKVATQCYNLKSGRQGDIQQWLRNWLVHDHAGTRTTFGPLLLEVQHTPEGEVLLWFTRTGIPGKSPWINHCVS